MRVGCVNSQRTEKSYAYWRNFAQDWREPCHLNAFWFKIAAIDMKGKAMDAQEIGELMVQCHEVERKLKQLGGTGKTMGELIQSLNNVVRGSSLRRLRNVSDFRGRFLAHHNRGKAPSIQNVQQFKSDLEQSLRYLGALLHENVKEQRPAPNEFSAAKECARMQLSMFNLQKDNFGERTKNRSQPVDATRIARGVGIGLGVAIALYQAFSS